MNYPLLVLAMIFALFEWLAVGFSWRKVEYFTKPGVMVALILWSAVSGGFQGQMRWFTLGALFSLLGDIFLLTRRERLGFFLGLFSFLLAHCAYIAGINIPLTHFSQPVFLLGGIILIILLVIGSQLIIGIRKKRLRKLTIPISIYILTISTMLFFALSTNFRADWRTHSALLIGLGAILFAISDSCLAWNKFVSPLRYGRLVVMITYHLGQMGILLGAACQYLP